MSEFADITSDDDDAPTAPFWMTTFSDMVTLLLTFFVLIVSMSEIQVKRFQDALSYFTGQESVLEFQSVIRPEAPADEAERMDEETLREQAENYEELLAFIEANGLQEKVEVNLTREGLHMTMTDSVAFRSARADLMPAAQELLARVSAVLGDRVQSVKVEGHTDNIPIQTSQFPSNWELSAARATAVVRFFLQQEDALDPARYHAAGYGQHHPVSTNETREGRARNRRVEILFQTTHAE